MGAGAPHIDQHHGRFGAKPRPDAVVLSHRLLSPTSGFASSSGKGLFLPGALFRRHGVFSSKQATVSEASIKRSAQTIELLRSWPCSQAYALARFFVVKHS
jgi:hypothetical protein